MQPELLFGPSAAATRLAGQVERVAGTPRTTVLLRGSRRIELELTARAIHEASPAAGGPFVRVQAARHEGHPSPLATQEGGTFFLEEVADLDPRSQESLVATLEERVASTGSTAAARLVASTAKDLELEVEEGRFREDLFYRLNVLTLRVPGLDERIEDLATIANRLLAELRDALGRAFTLSADAVETLEARDWSGGLLELRATLTCAAVASGSAGTIEPGHVPGAAPSAPANSDALIPLPPRSEGRVLRDVEEAAIRRILIEAAGNRSQAARTLGINRTTLYNKMRLYGIQ